MASKVDDDDVLPRRADTKGSKDDDAYDRKGEIDAKAAGQAEGGGNGSIRIKAEDKDVPVRGAGEGEGEEEESLVHRVAKFFFEDETFANSFEKWVGDRAHLIDAESEECRLEYTELYEEFKQLFEDRITGYIEALGHTVTEFYEQIQEKLSDDPWSEESIFAQILVATTDFDIFMMMMREAAVKKKRESHK